MARSVIGGAGSILRVPSKRSPRSSTIIGAGGATDVTLPTTNLINDWNPDTLIGVLADNDPVSTLGNDSTGGDFTQSGTARPLFKENIVNGHAVLRFDGSDDWMLTTDPTALRGIFTIFVVCKGDVVAPGVPFGGPAFKYLWLQNNALEIYLGGGFLSNTTAANNVWNHYVVTSDDTTVKVYQNGTEIINTTDASAEWQAEQLGRFSSGLYFDGDIARIGDYSDCKTGGDLTALFTALDSIYGL